MPQDFIHYVRREVHDVKVECEPFYAELQSDLAGLSRPRYHTTRSLVGPAARVREGDTVWLVGRLFTPWGTLSPSVDARIDVAANPCVIEPSDEEAARGIRPRLRYEAAETSRWFHLADALPVLETLATRDARGTVTPLVNDPTAPIGRLLRSMRELDSGAPLRAWEAELDKKGFSFVSYRLLDGTEAAYHKVCTILGGGEAVFWDRWSLPRRLVERREQHLDDPALDKHIRENIESSQKVWLIYSPLYGARGTYSARELALARQCGKTIGRERVGRSPQREAS
jgi:hypothetical protein